MHRVSRKKDRTGSTVEQKRKATYSWRRENSKKRALCHRDDKHFRKYEYHRSQHLGVKQMTPSSPAGFHGLCTGRVYTRPLEHETKQEKGKEQNLCIAILTQPVNISILNKNNATCRRATFYCNQSDWTNTTNNGKRSPGQKNFILLVLGWGQKGWEKEW